ncbi:hypothetical protein [Pedobacter sp. MR2016-24]|uniref:hypothetical protein n=1 Tax=Pedobacter sp. MR2016-24 TaxID=2994466 RepID=UPI00224652D9|nr:hypothetical protein [Pedobacter sp. MR2016-24]MCX2483841.1 hypothetical protein [Pedobacter sp. MR2016-24]
MEILSLLHKGNITIHVFAGSLALLTGIYILFKAKRTRIHRISGRVFLLLLAIVVFTGLSGVFIFKRHSFLLVITVLSGYMGFSGLRAIRSKSNKPQVLDIAVAFLALASVIFFLWYFTKTGMVWSGIIIYSTVAYLIMAVVYDLSRYFIPKKVYGKLWLYEHILKMVSAFSGLLSAFSGTVLPQYQPYSQFLPSVLGSLIAVGFIISAGINLNKANTY